MHSVLFYQEDDWRTPGINRIQLESLRDSRRVAHDGKPRKHRDGHTFPGSRRYHIEMLFNVAAEITANRANLGGGDFELAHCLLSVVPARRGSGGSRRTLLI